MKNVLFGAVGRYHRLFLVLLFLSGCQTGPHTGPESPPEQKTASIAVWDLEDLSLSGPSHAEWGELFAAGVLQVFQESGRYTVVEREQLLLALEELRLGSSALADESTRLRLGRLIGARQMVFGSYLIIGDILRFDLRLVDVETGHVVKAAQKTVSPPDLGAGLTAVRAVAGKLL